MAKTLTKSPDPDLYEEDLPLLGRACRPTLLRAGRFDELDLDEPDRGGGGLGRGERGIGGKPYARLIIEHLLKLHYSPAAAASPRLAE